MDVKASVKAKKTVGVKSDDVVNAERYIVAGDDGKHYLLALSGDKPLYIYLVSYDLIEYKILGETKITCIKCGGPLTKFYIYKDIYGECDKGHLNHVGIIVAWQRPGEGSGE